MILLHDLKDFFLGFLYIRICVGIPKRAKSFRRKREGLEDKKGIHTYIWKTKNVNLHTYQRTYIPTYLNVSSFVWW